MFPFLKTKEMKYLESQTPEQHVKNSMFGDYINTFNSIIKDTREYFPENCKVKDILLQEINSIFYSVNPETMPEKIIVQKWIVERLNEKNTRLSDVAIAFMQLKISEYLYKKYGDQQ